MKFHLQALILALLSAALVCPVSPAPAPLYPQYRLTPQTPSMNDSVSFRLVKGINGNSCVPTYRTSFSVVQTSNNVCVRAPCPQDYTLKLLYSPLPMPLGVACLEVLTEYGPRFNFGLLKVGNYTLVDSSDGNKTLMRFAVTELGGDFGVRGIVCEDVGRLALFIPVQGAKVYLKRPRAVTLPMYPPVILYDVLDSTTTDATGAYAFKSVAAGSLTLGFVAKGYQPLDKPFAVPPDTLVSAALLPDNAFARVTGTVYEAMPVSEIGCAPSPVGCVLGPVPGCSVAVQLPVLLLAAQEKSAATAPVYLGPYTAVTDKLGTYVIDSIPLSGATRNFLVSAHTQGFVQQSKQDTLHPRTGTAVYFALKRPTATQQNPTALEKAGQSKPVVTYMANSRTLRLVFDRAQSVSMSAYILNSRKVEQLSRKRFLAAGTYTIGLKSPRLSGGVIVFRVEGEGFCESVRINLAK